jgi:hypothetical protein
MATRKSRGKHVHTKTCGHHRAAEQRAAATEAQKARVEKIEKGIHVMVQLSHLNDQWMKREERVNEGEEDATIMTIETHNEAHKEAAEIVALLERLPIVSRAMLNKQAILEKEAWGRHVALREHVKPNSTADVKNILYLSWTAYIRHALLCQQMMDALHPHPPLQPDENGEFEEWPAALGLTASDFDYVRLVESRVDIKASSAPLGNYNIAELMLAIVSLRDALDAYGWVPSASHYFRALLWRYALSIAYPAKNYCQFPGADYEILQEADMDPFFAPAEINRDFLRTSERLFFHMTWRMRALRGFVEPEWYGSPINPAGAHVAWAKWRCNHGVPGLQAALLYTLKRPIVGEIVDETLTNNIMDYFTMPGEREQLLFDFPDESDSSATNVIFRLRTEFHSKIQFLYKDKVTDTLDHYMILVKLMAARFLREHKETTAAVTTETADLRRREYLRFMEFDRALLGHQEIHERAIFLLTMIAFDTQATVDHCGAPFQRHCYPDNQARAAPSDRPPLGPHATSTMASVLNKIPMFLIIWSVYIVIDTTGKVRWVTPHFVDAFAVWLSLVFKDGHLKSPGIVQHWKPILDHLPPLFF